MATITPRTLILSDPQNRHGRCDSQFNNRLFVRFTDLQDCRNHIRIHVTNPDCDVHFFFPDVQVELIKKWLPPDHSDTVQYIYCYPPTSPNSIKRKHGRRVAHRIFTAEDLEFEIGHVQVSLLYSKAKQAPEESSQRDEVALIAMQQLDCLGHKLKQLMTDQLGESPIERN
jgi:hypothetical protein